MFNWEKVLGWAIDMLPQVGEEEYCILSERRELYVFRCMSHINIAT